MKIIYGPVASWRLGKSLGIDLICRPKKTCSFDCIYCQLEQTEKITAKKDTFISIEKLKKELEKTLQQTKPDVITLSGMGEPTLANNIDEAIAIIRKATKIPIAILTNSTLLNDKKVQKNLEKIDIVVAKLDAPNQKLFQKINRPVKQITFENTLKGIKSFRKNFKGKFALQIMFMNENKKYSADIAKLAKQIQPDEVQINTPLRPCSIEPLSKKELDEIEKQFNGLNTISVYNSPKPKTSPLDKLELIKRRRMET